MFTVVWGHMTQTEPACHVRQHELTCLYRFFVSSSCREERRHDWRLSCTHCNHPLLLLWLFMYSKIIGITSTPLNHFFLKCDNSLFFILCIAVKWPQSHSKTIHRCLYNSDFLLHHIQRDYVTMKVNLLVLKVSPASLTSHIIWKVTHSTVYMEAG